MKDETISSDLDEFLGDTRKKRLPTWAKWVIGAAVLIVLVVLVRAFMGGGGKHNYATEPARMGNMEVHVTATGNLKPINQVTVGSEVSGLITKVYVDVNDKVVEGQPLAQIDIVKLQDAINRAQAALVSAQASVDQAQATADQSKATLARDEEVARVSGGKVPSKTELDSARADYARAVANVGVAKANVTSSVAALNSAKTDLSKATIRSPVTGVILSRQVDPGQTVAASFSTPTLFLIAQDLSKMELEVKVDEADVGQVKAGQQASFTVDAYPGKVFPADITRVNVGSNSSTSTTSTTTTTSGGVISYGALLVFNNPNQALLPGMTATATIITAQEKNVLMVPNAALRFEPKKSGAGNSPGASAGPQPAGGVLPVGPVRFRRQSTQEVGFSRGSKRTVYTLDESGKPVPHTVFTGSTNGTETIVTSKTLKPGMQVVTGELAAAK